MATRKKAPGRRVTTLGHESVDPVETAVTEVERRISAQSGSILHRTPIREWLLGLVEYKSLVGGQLPWNEIITRLMDAADAAVKPGAKITVEGKKRPPTKDELKVLRLYSENPKVETSVKNYLRRMHPRLWTRVKAASNGRGTGVRRDEEVAAKSA